jgi:cytochrome c peroxidase
MTARLPLRIALVCAVLAGCASGGPDLSGEPRASLLPPVQNPADNLPTPEKVALGKQLFVDKRLSNSGTMACQSCHYRHLGWTDGQVLSRKDDGNLNTRHTPSLYNVGYQSAWYWDGRATTFEGQILAAWKGQMSGDPVKVAALLNAVPGYAVQFQQVFGAPASGETIAKALAAYLRTKNSDNSPWDRFEVGQKTAVSSDAVAGQALFAGKGRCATCHAAPYYGNSTFYNIGLEAGKAKPDPGRYNVTKNEADIGAFKTPSLRSIALSAPYFHDGSVASLRDAVRYMASGGGFDPRKSAALVPTGLSDSEIDQVVAFLRSLTSDEPWVAPTLP